MVGMFSSAEGIVMESETGETKDPHDLTLSGALGGTPNNRINLLRKPQSGKCRQRHYQSRHGHKYKNCQKQ